MKLKVRGTQFDERHPIMITLTPKDKEAINNMPEDATRYASFPADAGWDEDEMAAWMDRPGVLMEHFHNGDVA